MKLKFLGTAGCSGIPNLFCGCPVCENARKVKGREIRTRSGFVLDDKIAIDFSPDSYSNMTRYDVKFGMIEHLMVTHSHEDHFYPQDLVLRVTATRAPYPTIAEKLNIYGNEKVLQTFKAVDFYKEKVLQAVNLIQIKRDNTYDVGGYKVTTFYAAHMFTEDSMVFLFQHENKNYLHLVDSPFPPQEFFDYLVEHQIKLDGVTGDCTFGSMVEEFGGHMQIWQNIKIKEKLNELGLAKENMQYYLTHFSEWNGKDTYESLSKLAKEYGLIVAYDGMEVEF